MKLVREGDLRLKECAKRCGVTIRIAARRRDGKRDSRKQAGGNRFFTDDEELLVADCIERMQKRGFCLSKSMLSDALKEFALDMSEERRLKCPFKDFEPGRWWLSSFIKRHSRLRAVRAQLLEDQRALAMNPWNLADFCSKLNHVMKICPIKNANAHNCDETGVSLREFLKGRKCIAVADGGRSEIRVPHIPGDAERASVAATARSDGTHIPPFAIFKGVRPRHRHRPARSMGGQKQVETLHDALPPGAAAVMAPSGGMEGSAWDQHAECFVKQTVRKAQDGEKMLLLIDGRKTRISFKSVSTFIKGGAELLCSPSRTSHKLQPLDASVFRVMKQKRADAMHKVMGRCLQVGKKDFDVFDLAECLSAGFVESMSPANILAGFKKPGIAPFNPRKRQDLFSADEDANPGNPFGPTERKKGHTNDLALLRNRLSATVHKRVSEVEWKRGAISTTNTILLSQDKIVRRLRAEEKQKQESAAEKKRKTEEREEKKRARDLKAAIAEAQAEAVRQRWFSSDRCKMWKRSLVQRRMRQKGKMHKNRSSTPRSNPSKLLVEF